MLRKKVLLLLLLANTVAMANVKLNVKSKVESRHVGEFYNNISKLDFYKDEEIFKFTPLDLKVEFNEKIKLGVEVYKTKQKGIRNNKNLINPRVNFSIKTMDILNSNITYSLVYDKYDNFYNFIEANNINHNLKFNFNDKLNLIFDFDTVNAIVQKRSITIGNDILKYTNTKILDTEKHLKKLRNIQNELVTEDDGHNHNKNKDVFSYLDYGLQGFKYSLLNSENKIEFNKDFKIEKIDSKLNVNAKYTYLTMKNSFSIEEKENRRPAGLPDADGLPVNIGRTNSNNTNLTSRPISRVNSKKETKHLIFDIKKHDFTLDLNLEKEFISNLKTKFGTSLAFVKVAQNIEIDEIKSPVNKKTTEKILVNSEVLSNNTLSNSIYVDVNYLYRPISKFSLLSGLRTNLQLKTTWKEYEKNYENLRKQAYEKELEASKKKKEEIAKYPEKLKQREKELVKLKTKWEEEKQKLDEFADKRDYTEEVDILYKDEMKKPQNKGKKEEDIRVLIRRDDELKFKEKFKKEFANNKLEDINKMIVEKNKELEKFEKENIENSKKRELTNKIRNAKTLEERSKLIKDFADKNQMSSLSSKANEYAELLEYRGIGAYATFNSKLISKRTSYQLKANSEYKKYSNKIKEIEVDPFIYQNYKVILDGKKAKYNLNVLLNPYVNISYHITPRLSMIGKISSEIELSKDFSSKSKLNHHIHFTPSFEVKYVW